MQTFNSDEAAGGQCYRVHQEGLASLSPGSALIGGAVEPPDLGVWASALLERETSAFRRVTGTGCCLVCYTAHQAVEGVFGLLQVS